MPSPSASTTFGSDAVVTRTGSMVAVSATGALGKALIGGEHGAQQHIGPRRHLSRFGFFQLVMAQPAFAGHENHRSGGDARDIGGVMPGARDDLARRIGVRGGGVAHGSD